MRFAETAIAGAWTIDLEPIHDDRGFFARCFCAREFAAHGLPASFVQSSVSSNPSAGTLRGMHYEAAPGAEAKLVRCTRGAVFDVVLDLRAESKTYRKWLGFELNERNFRALFVPPGCAHGFLTLKPDTELHYQMTTYHAPALARGVRWDDPAFSIAWPAGAKILSPRDAAYPDFSP